MWSRRVYLLRVPLPDVVTMQTRQPNLEGAGEIPLRRLVKEAVRMRPSRLIVGEVRQEECLDLTQSTQYDTGLLRHPVRVDSIPSRPKFDVRL
jgi:Flp pilus assembly CpaF family ATPase